jgi:hypothetical protein
MARFGVRSVSVVCACLVEDPVSKRFERTCADGREHRAHLPCRGSWVRVPSSALRMAFAPLPRETTMALRRARYSTASSGERTAALTGSRHAVPVRWICPSAAPRCSTGQVVADPIDEFRRRSRSGVERLTRLSSGPLPDADEPGGSVDTPPDSPSPVTRVRNRLECAVLASGWDVVMTRARSARRNPCKSAASDHAMGM